MHQSPETCLPCAFWIADPGSHALYKKAPSDRQIDKWFIFAVPGFDTQTVHCCPPCWCHLMYIPWPKAHLQQSTCSHDGKSYIAPGSQAQMHPFCVCRSWLDTAHWSLPSSRAPTRSALRCLAATFIRIFSAVRRRRFLPDRCC